MFHNFTAYGCEGDRAIICRGGVVSLLVYRDYVGLLPSCWYTWLVVRGLKYGGQDGRQLVCCFLEEASCYPVWSCGLVNVLMLTVIDLFPQIIAKNLHVNQNQSRLLIVNYGYNNNNNLEL